MHERVPAMSSDKNKVSEIKTGGSKLGRGIKTLIGSSSAVEVAAPAIEVPIQVSKESEEKIKKDTGVIFVPLEALKPSPFQPRRTFDETALKNLANSIKHSGIMAPIIVREVGGQYELIAGERRWRASQLLGSATIPAIVRVLSDEQAAEWALVENVQREDLNPIERATALKHIEERFGAAHSDIAQRLGMDRSTVSNLLRLLDLEPEIREMVEKGQITAGHARALLPINNAEQRLRLAKECIAQGMSVRRLEYRASTFIVKPGSAEKNKNAAKDEDGELTRREAVVGDLEKQLGRHLGTRVEIETDKTGKAGKMIITFYSLDHFDGLVHKMGADVK